MRNRLTKLFVALATCSLMVVMASPTLAQWPDRYRNYDRYGSGDVERLVRQAENRSDQFARMIEQSRYRGGLLQRIFTGDRVSALAAQAHDLESQLNVVRQELYRNEDSYGLRSRIANVLSTAQSIENTMRYQRVSYGVERQWSMLRSDLNRLARAFDLRQIG